MDSALNMDTPNIFKTDKLNLEISLHVREQVIYKKEFF